MAVEEPAASSSLPGRQKWVADFTDIRTWQGRLYLAVVVDVYSRMVVGWSMCDDMHALLVVDAAKVAVWRRHLTGRVIHHSDQGAQPEFKRSSQHRFGSFEDSWRLCAVGRL